MKKIKGEHEKKTSARSESHKNSSKLFTRRWDLIDLVLEYEDSTKVNDPVMGEV